jgi:membrane protease YdiL (CAAX protease family)
VKPAGRSRCAACGAVVKREARFCPSCGAYRNPPADRRARRRAGREGWRSVLLVIALYFCILATVLPLHLIDEDDRPSAQIFLSILIAIVVIGFIPAMRIDLTPLVVPRRSTPLWCGLALAVLVPIVLLNLGYHRLLLEILGIDPGEPPWVRAGWSPALVVLMICVMPGIVEEIAFRGLIHGAVKGALGGSGAIVLTAALFAIIHQSVPSMPVLFVVGLYLGWLRHRSGSLLPCVLAHFAHNLAIVRLS